MAPFPLRVRSWQVAAALGLALALAGGARHLAGAQPASDPRAPETDTIAFRHLTADDGLPSEAVADVAQDALGFIWIGTGEGLARYDGEGLVTYRRSSDSTSLSGNVVQVLAPAGGGALWVGTLTGLSRYDPARDAFLRIAGLPSEDVLALEPDSAGAWVGTSEGLARVDGQGRATRVAGVPGRAVEDVLRDGEGTLWVGTDDGLLRRRAGADHFDTFRPPDSLAAPDGAFRVTALDQTDQGALLVGTFGGGLLAFDIGRETFSSLPIGTDPIAQNVMDVLADAEGVIWAATLGGGLRKLTPGDPEPTLYRPSPEDPTSLSGNEVTALLEDRQGVLWVATYSGLDRFDRARGTALRLRHTPGLPSSLSSNDVRAVLRTEEALYVGTDLGLDRSTDGQRFAHATFESQGVEANPVRALLQDREGTLWVGTERDGLYRSAAGGGYEKVPLLRQPQGAAEAAVTSVLEDGAGRLWVGTLANGLALFDRESGRAIFYGPQAGRARSLRSSQVRALAADARGALWVGTDDGLCRLNRATTEGDFTCFAAGTAGLASGYVHALHARPDGTLWVGTDAGFYRLDTDAPEAGFTAYTPETSDLPGEAVYAIVEDEYGRLWLSTNGGLARFEPVDETFFQRLDASDAERSLGAAATRGPDGRLFFGSTRGLLAFHPDRLSALNPNPPQVVITRVDVRGQPVVPGQGETGGVLAVAAPVAERIELTPDQSFLTIHYAGLHFSDPSANTYRYRLVGEVDEWIENEGDREASFPTLAPGKYTFEVEAANADGVGFDMGRASIEVVMHPPWWRRWWAILGFAAFAVFGLVRADRYQRERLLRQERERAERRETELRAETAEAEQRKATAEAAALKAENERKATELERARDVEAANAKLAESNAQLEASLRDLRATQDQLVQSEKLASLGQLTAGIAHEIKNPLNFVNNFADLSVELADELREELGGSPERPVGEVLGDVEDLIEDLKDNARRIREHGQRADRIVRSMLLHSRGGSAERGRVDLNRFVEEYANLAYHGARANDSDFQVDLVRDYDEAAGEAEIVPQEFGRVLINLLTNAFHAVAERKRRSGGDAYQPVVTVRTRRQGDEVEVAVQDNGTGIPENVQARIFEPFFTTKPTGEGTGLGLSLAYDIITKVHDGRMGVESVLGEGTTFEVAVPAVRGDAPEAA